MQAQETPKRQAQVPEALEDLSTRIGEMVGAVEGLEERLQTVMSSKQKGIINDENANMSETPEDRADLANDLDRLSFSVRRSTAIVRYILERLEV